MSLSQSPSRIPLSPRARAAPASAAAAAARAPPLSPALALLSRGDPSADAGALDALALVELPGDGLGSAGGDALIAAQDVCPRALRRIFPRNQSRTILLPDITFYESVYTILQY